MDYLLPKFLDWRRFQDFCADILDAEGFTIVRKSGMGPDRGSDIIVERLVEYGPRCYRPFRWIVQCKYRQSDQKSIRPEDIGEFLSDIARHDADGYWLMTNTYLSSGLEDKLASISENRDLPYQATYSDVADLVSCLYKHRLLVRKYCLPTSPHGHVAAKRIVSPFKKLHPYTEDDRLMFFGRDGESDALMDRIYMHRIVGLFGESGTGKTSLLHAGIVPMLRDEGLSPIVVRCLDEPITRVRKAVLAQFNKEGINALQLERLGATAELSDFLRIVQKIAGDAGLRIVLMIDQFEELFTRCRLEERQGLAKGILEATSTPGGEESLTVLLSLREDYIGNLWDWSHSFGLLGAWINTYRLGRLSDDAATSAISGPLKAAGITVPADFLSELTADLMTLGDGEVYPPYLQLACSRLFEVYSTRRPNGSSRQLNVALYESCGRAESMIAEYISTSMLQGLNERDRLLAQQILDLLTGPEGLRAFLSGAEMARYLQVEEPQALRVVEHLTQKKVVHPVVEDDQLIGYELVHDFLSRRFFESLSPEAQKMKTVLDLFRRAFREWKNFEVLASKDRLVMFQSSISQLNPTEEEYSFLLKSSLLGYQWSNPWIKIIPESVALKYCGDLLSDEDYEDRERVIEFLARQGNRKAVPYLQAIIRAGDTPSRLKGEAISAFGGYWGMVDKRVLGDLQTVFNESRDERLRAKAIDALGGSLRKLLDKELTNRYWPVLFKALSDSRANVRAKAVEGLSSLKGLSIIDAFLERLSVENSVVVRKKIVDGLVRFREADTRIVEILEKIAVDRSEDPRVQNAAARTGEH